MFNPRTFSGQRFSALWNGVVIGVGIGLFPIGLIFALIGIGLEYWQRRRLRNQPACPNCGRPYE